LFFDDEDLTKTKKARLSSLELIDKFNINFDEKHYELFSDQELFESAGGTLVFDCECYINYFIVAFKCHATKRVVYFEDCEGIIINTKKLEWVIHNFCIVGFNSIGYDLPLVAMAMQGHRAETLKYASNQIILANRRQSDLEKEFEVVIPHVNHIDLIEVAPLRASLKLYGGRLHTARMQELPIPHDRPLTQLEAKVVKLYCINDLDITGDLLTNLKPHLDLRTQMSYEYRQDLRSKSDAQIAEAVISTELRKINGWFPKKPKIEPGTVYYYQVPQFIQYQSPELQQVLEIVRRAKMIVSDSGSVEMPPEISKLKIKIGDTTYKMGIGGLHSSESCIAHRADDNNFLIDKDVASYYPAIILNLELYPKHLGKNFLRVYRDIVNRRLKAKREGNKVINESLKITINGSFGKLGNKYSSLYSPDLLIQVTMTGQLALLLLIEMLEYVGISVLSANTDGVLIRCPKDRYNYMEAQVIHWQRVTGFETEETRYNAIYCRDVNNYIAVKENGECKMKGTYTEKGSSGNTVLSKNPEAQICNDAVVAFLSKGTLIEETITACQDVRRFITIRQVKGGAEKSGVYLGKAVRWYYSTEAKGQIDYVTNGNKVPNSDNAMPAMDLPKECPKDLDRDYYINKAKEILNEIGYYAKPKVIEARLF
jgi:DNA polymerase elongation subunit (family B)